MLKLRIKKRADHEAREIQRLTRIEASVTALPDEDLLDLADIFKGDPHTPLAQIAAAEMGRRRIAL